MNKKKLKFNAKEQEQEQCHRMIIHAKKGREGQIDPNTYGSIAAALENVCHQEFGEEFTEHTVFLCSNKYKIQ